MGLNSLAILNEETVVALCFVSFLKFAFDFFGQSIQESLDERTQSIKSEFQQALELEQSYCQALIREAELPLKKMKAFLKISEPLLAAKLLYYQTTCANSLKLSVQAKLTENHKGRSASVATQLNVLDKTYSERWISLISSDFQQEVYRNITKETLQNRILVQAIDSIKSRS